MVDVAIKAKGDKKTGKSFLLSKVNQDLYDKELSPVMDAVRDMEMIVFDLPDEVEL